MRTYNDYLVHRDHKYVMKIGNGPNARYFYSQAELDAYRKLKGGIKNELRGIKRFRRALKGSGNVSYNPDGKTYSRYKYTKNKKGERVAKMGKKRKTGHVERGMLAAYRILHPGE